MTKVRPVWVVKLGDSVEFYDDDPKLPTANWFLSAQASDFTYLTGLRIPNGKAVQIRIAARLV